MKDGLDERILSDAEVMFRAGLAVSVLARVLSERKRGIWRLLGIL